MVAAAAAVAAAADAAPAAAGDAAPAPAAAADAAPAPAAAADAAPFVAAIMADVPQSIFPIGLQKLTTMEPSKKSVAQLAERNQSRQRSISIQTFHMPIYVNSHDNSHPASPDDP